MIQIYNRNNTDYNHNGDMVLTPTVCELSAEINSAWELTLTHPIDDNGRWKYIEEEAVVSAPTFQSDSQLFRIHKVEKKDTEVTATAWPIFFDSAKDCFIMDTRPENKTGQEALSIMTSLNPKYSASSDIKTRTTAYFVRRNLMDAINGTDNPTFIGRWGGEVLYDNYKIIIDKQIGGDYGVDVRYGKNINGLTYNVDMSEVVTRIVPVSYNGYTLDGATPWVDSPNISKFATVYTKEVKFENVKMREDAQEEDEEEDVIICDTLAELRTALIAESRKEFEAGVDVPKVTIEVDLALLENTSEYADYKMLEKVSLGDTVHCIHNKLEITSKLRAVNLTWDCIRNQCKSMTLGDFEYNYFDKVSSTVDRVDSAIRSDGSVVAERVQGIIDGVAAQMRAQSTIAKKSSVRAVLFEDLDPDSNTFGAMCFGTMGFQIASERTADGRDWKWTTFGTGQGFFADYVVFGSMLCDRIRGGLLQLGGVSGKDGILSVLDKDGEEIGRWDLNGINVKKGDIKGTTITLGGQNNIDGLLKLLDALGNEIVRLDKDGVYAKGKYVSEGLKYGRNVEISEGAFKVLNKDGSIVGMLQAISENWMRLETNGGAAIRFIENEMYFDADKIGPGIPGKSGRAVFSDGTHLDFKQGFLIGGNTKEGSF